MPITSELSEARETIAQLRDRKFKRQESAVDVEAAKALQARMAELSENLISANLSQKNANEALAALKVTQLFCLLLFLICALG